MTTDTFTGGTGDGQITGGSATYATARATSSASNDSSTGAQVGQRWSGSLYTVDRAFLVFDTSSIPDDATVTAATLYITAGGDGSTTDFLVQVYRFAWADTLASNREANYDGAYGGSATLEGTLRDTAAGWVDGTQYSMAVDPAGINLTGTTRYTLVSSRDVAGNTPTGQESVQLRTADHGTPGSRPQLEVTYTAGEEEGAPNTLLLMGTGG